MAKPSLLSQLAAAGPAAIKEGMRQQFGALCWRFDALTKEIEVLLITTRETGRWAIPKGWPMKGKLGHKVAEQEAYEEAGVRGTVEKRPFGYFTYLKALEDGTKVPCMVQVHLLEVLGMRKNFKEKGQRRFLWCSSQDAASMVDDAELKGLFRLFDERRRGR